MASLANNDPAALVNLERFLFNKIGPQFRKSGTITPEDFWLILVWKANRSKRFAKRRFKEDLGLEWNDAVAQIVSGLVEANSDRERLELLMGDQWKFQLPTASAILSVMYTDRFSVYDYRVCESLMDLGCGDFRKLKNKRDPDSIWVGFTRYLLAVGSVNVGHTSLRHKDRYLWGKSVLKDLETELG